MTSCNQSELSRHGPQSNKPEPIVVAKAHRHNNNTPHFRNNLDRAHNPSNKAEEQIGKDIVRLSNDISKQTLRTPRHTATSGSKSNANNIETNNNNQEHKIATIPEITGNSFTTNRTMKQRALAAVLDLTGVTRDEKKYVKAAPDSLNADNPGNLHPGAPQSQAGIKQQKPEECGTLDTDHLLPARRTAGDRIFGMEWAVRAGITSQDRDHWSISTYPLNNQTGTFCLTDMVIRGCLRGANEFATPSAQDVMSHSQLLQSRNSGDIVGALTALARQMKVSMCTVGKSSTRWINVGPQLGDKIEVDYDRGTVRVWIAGRTPTTIPPVPALPQPTKASKPVQEKKTPLKRLYVDSPEVVAAIAECEKHTGSSYPPPGVN
jgi:hypothetical protein